MQQTSSIFEAKPAQTSPNEELATRGMFRKRNYLTSPAVSKQHVSISGVPLSSGLVNFCTTGADNHAKLVDSVIHHHTTTAMDKPSAVKCLFQPVYTACHEEAEALKLENQTNSDLHDIVESSLHKIANDSSRDA